MSPWSAGISNRSPCTGWFSQPPVFGSGASDTQHKCQTSNPTNRFYRDLLPKLPDKPTIYLPNIDPLALAPLVAFIYGGEAKVAKTLLSSFMEVANILMIDGLSDKDRIEKVKRDPLLEEENKENPAQKDQLDVSGEIELLETKLEEGMSCDSCNFRTTAKAKNNQTSVMNRHKRTAHGEDKDGLTDIVVDKREDIFESSKEELNEGGLSCGICGFVSTAKSKSNQQSVMGRHNRKVHGIGEYGDSHLSDNSEPKEEQIITLDEDLKEPPHDEESSDETEESCRICGFKSVARTKWNRSTVLKRHMRNVHESKTSQKFLCLA